MNLSKYLKRTLFFAGIVMTGQSFATDESTIKKYDPSRANEADYELRPCLPEAADEIGGYPINYIHTPHLGVSSVKDIVKSHAARYRVDHLLRNPAHALGWGEVKEGTLKREYSYQHTMSPPIGLPFGMSPFPWVEYLWEGKVELVMKPHPYADWVHVDIYAHNDAEKLDEKVVSIRLSTYVENQPPAYDQGEVEYHLRSCNGGLFIWETGNSLETITQFKLSDELVKSENRAMMHTKGLLATPSGVQAFSNQLGLRALILDEIVKIEKDMSELPAPAEKIILQSIAYAAVGFDLNRSIEAENIVNTLWAMPFELTGDLITVIEANGLSVQDFVDFIMLMYPEIPTDIAAELALTAFMLYSNGIQTFFDVVFSPIEIINSSS